MVKISSQYLIFIFAEIWIYRGYILFWSRNRFYNRSTVDSKNFITDFAQFYAFKTFVASLYPIHPLSAPLCWKTRYFWTPTGAIGVTMKQVHDLGENMPLQWFGPNEKPSILIFVAMSVHCCWNLVVAMVMLTGKCWYRRWSL